MPRALLSVADKTDIVEFARALVARGYDVVSTGGTARALEAASVPVMGVSDITGMPEMLDGRVKTLHPAVHAGILARRSRPDDLTAISRHGIGLIDIVAVNLYPFVEAARNPELPFDALIEEIDIGGPSLVRAAAKNFADVIIVVSPSDYRRVVAELDRPEGPPRAFRFELARKAFAHTAAYDSAISATLGRIELREGKFDRMGLPVPALDDISSTTADDRFPPELMLNFRKVRDLRYGENPHQAAAWYAIEPPTGLGAAQVLQGKELSFTNLLDLDAARRLVFEFDEPAAAIIKHTNPSGAAIGDTLVDAYLRARDADSMAAFGGVVGLNREIDEVTARAMTTTRIDVVVAPGVSSAAAAILATRSNMRVIVAGRLDDEPGRLDWDIRGIEGAALVQYRDWVQEADKKWSSQSASAAGLYVVTRRAPTDEEWAALRFAWRVCAHVKSNTVVFTTATHTLAIGAGQMSRVDAVRVAVMKAGDSARLKGSVAASDAFFPFRDGLDAVAGAGATAIVQPGGAMRDAELIAAANEHGLAMVFTGRRHFRH
jgi:phosphoribosylaminoimidazolecarboxamide formyltransferase/IMP cyclohydrolase